MERNHIAKLIFQMTKSWNEENLEEYMEGYWKSPDLTYSSPNGITKGWDEALERYRQSYQREGRDMGKLSIKIVSIDVSASEERKASLLGKWGLEHKDGETAQGEFSLKLVKFDDPIGWKITEDHST
eukprot:gene6206-6679_t